MKMPETKIRGRRIRLETIITLEGLLIAGDESRVPRAAKVNPPRINVTARSRGWARGRWRRSVPAVQTIVVMTIPKSAPARMSPRMILSSVTGRERRRSYVFSRFSHGVISGPVEEEEKNSIMPRNAGKKRMRLRFLPIKKVKNIRKGNRRPKITTAPL